MTQDEFKSVMDYLKSGSGKSPADGKALLVYFDCLGDLDFEAFKLGAKWTLMNHKFATFPSIAELREATVAAARGAVVELAPVKAWEIAWKIIGNTDPEIEGSFARASKDAPRLVLDTIRALGLAALCHGTEPVSIVRAQFMRTFEQLADGEKRRALLPASLVKAIEDRGPNSIKAVAAMLLDGIGQPDKPAGGAK